MVSVTVRAAQLLRSARLNPFWTRRAKTQSAAFALCMVKSFALPARPGRGMSMSLLQDVRFAIRLLVKDRGIAGAASMALAVGIGLNAMVFTVVDALLLRNLPFEDPGRLMYLGERDTVTGRAFMVSWPDFQDWRESQRSFAELGAWSAGTMNVSDDEHPA